MEKILFGIGHENAEKLLKETILRNNPNHVICDDVIIHKGRQHIIEKIRDNNPTIVILRETLKGTDDLVQTIYLIQKYFNVRIIFIAKNRKPGDKLLATLVSYSIFDIIAGTEINIEEIANLVEKKNTIQDVYHLLPKPTDEDYDELIFEGEEPESEAEDEKDEEPRVRNPFGIIKRIKNEEKAEDEPEDDLDIEKILASAKPIKKERKETQRLFGKSIEEHAQSIYEDEDNEEDYDSKQNDFNNEYYEEEIEESKPKRNKSKTRKTEPKPIRENDDIEDDIELEDFRRRKILKNPFSKKTVVDNRRKIITFFGAKSGIGTTVASINTAVSLALQNKNVLYIETNDKTPSVSYWYDIKTLNGGLEKALFGIETQDYKMCSDAIVTYNDLIIQESNMHTSHLKFPKTLSFLSFSEDYVRGVEKSSINPNSFKDLLMFLLHQKGYDYIILDVNTNSNSILIETGLIFSYKNVIVVSQDVASIGYAMLYFNKLEKKGLDFNLVSDQDNNSKSSKNLFLVNRYYHKSNLNEKVIRAWLEINKVYVLPENTLEINDTTFNGVPTYLASKNKEFKNSINYLISHI